ncbi:MAG TPA: hypothetical protein VFL90_16935, partial [Methylomirabilota bacterium]|nr:hypothetical protein [Methylomirabilota bacterium]
MAARSIVARSALGLAIYSLCVVFVFSFILFEVLDIDGSDFPSSATQAIAAEAPHADVRRTPFDAAPDPIVPPAVPALREPERVTVPAIGVARPAAAPVQSP